VKKKLLISIILAVALLLIPVSGAFALTSQNVTVTAAPAFISIANTPSDWTINGITGSGKIVPNTTY
jgi:flagellar basal body-associated protein FliL